MLRPKLRKVGMTDDNNFCVIPRPLPSYLRMVGGVPTRTQLRVKPCMWAANPAKFHKAAKQFPQVLMLVEFPCACCCLCCFYHLLFSCLLLVWCSSLPWCFCVHFNGVGAAFKFAVVLRLCASVELRNTYWPLFGQQGPISA